MHLKTRLRSLAMQHFSTSVYLDKQRNKARKRRGNDPAVVHYFHQVDDPYSHLAVQKLDQLRAHYNLSFQVHLVSKPEAAYLGSAGHFDHWALQDAVSIAADFNTTFAPAADTPTISATAVLQANQVLAVKLTSDDFAKTAIRTGAALWGSEASSTGEASGNGEDPCTGDEQQSGSSNGTGQQAVTQGNRLREKLGHYQGAMFYFEGEWFWGVDRLRLLEQRLLEEGFAEPGATLCVPEPTALDTTALDCSNITLEYFPSLRSPYTAIGHDRVLALIARSGVAVKVRPVMPMLMRGIPAPRAKQRYIISDAGREGRAHGAPFGRIVDPFGEPVKKAFALFAGAVQLNRELEFVTAYLQAAWFEGIDITRESGLQQVADNAGLQWGPLREAAAESNWQAILAENLDAMLAQHLWGVPSFQVSGGNAPEHAESYACWGQDRIWRVESEIARRI